MKLHFTPHVERTVFSAGPARAGEWLCIVPPEDCYVKYLFGMSIYICHHLTSASNRARSLLQNWCWSYPIDIRWRIARMKPYTPTPLEVLTIGHSTRPIEEFIHLLKSHAVRRLVDVRTIPRSRHNPQFGRDRLAPALHNARIHYRHMPGLGGLRHARPDSPNTGWRNAGFRGFADYMGTGEFEESLDELIALARQERTAIMCAEAVPWRCHRSLIADALLVRGIHALEIASATQLRPHSLTPWAKVDGTRISYPPPDAGAV